MNSTEAKTKIAAAKAEMIRADKHRKAVDYTAEKYIAQEAYERAAQLFLSALIAQ